MTSPRSPLPTSEMTRDIVVQVLFYGLLFGGFFGYLWLNRNTDERGPYA